MGGGALELMVNAFISKRLNQLDRIGISLEQCTDFVKVEDLFSKLGKTYLTPHLDPSQNDFTAANCFWLVAYRNEEPFGIGGIRMDDLTTESIDRYWKRHFGRLYKGGIDQIAAPIIDVLKGRICYIGDFYIAPHARGSIAFLVAITQIAHALIKLKWDPDYTYAFLHEKSVNLGAAVRYGFTQTIPFSKRFSELDHVRANNEYCAILSRADFMEIIQTEWNSSQQQGL